jgi:hypothetical protein
VAAAGRRSTRLYRMQSVADPENRDERLMVDVQGFDGA